MIDGLMVKIADFGTSKNLDKPFPFTSYVSTRWYRAPECCLRARDYGKEVDIFSIGCIMAELYLMRPIFPGSSELD
jgi:serine/threonine protein kinase